MKWTKELDEKLIELINEGKKHLEIAHILQTTKKSVSNRCDRLGLRIITTKEYKCKNCGSVFISYIKEEREFCSRSCSNSFSNKNRKLSEETKKKISKTLSNKNINQKLIVNKKKILRKCRFCNLPKIDKKHNIICEDCRMEYYKFYRPSCEFTFDFNKLKDRFDVKLVEEYGWYSPLNKGNNLGGISRDHMYSVREGFINKIDPEIIKHPANCKLLIHSDNNRKNFNSTISFDELISRIKNW